MTNIESPTNAELAVIAKWEENCVKWCKQKKNIQAAEDVADCSKLCFRRKLENEADAAASNRWYNSLRGYSLVAGRESSSFEPKTNVSEAASGSFRKESQDYELDVGEGLYQAGKKAETVGKATINGGYTMARQYVRSWQDGTQTAFLQRCFDSLKNGDDLNAFVSHAKKAYNDTFTDRPQADLAPQPDITPPPTKGE